jgi:SAM-dependent methyltransferase
VTETVALPVRYDKFAAIADDYWNSFGPEFAELVFLRILKLLRHSTMPIRRVLDLGCGTGTFALKMAGRGMHVTGLDASGAALRVAAHKAAIAKLSVRWVRGDMRRFSVSRRLDLITSIFNSVNHVLTERDLHSMLTSVRRALVPGGYFLFDLNHRACFEEVWGGTSIVRGDNWLVVRDDRINRTRHRAAAHLFLFFRRGSRIVGKEDLIEERWFHEKTIRRAIRRAGMKVVSKKDFNPFPRSLGYSRDIKSLWLLQRGDV